MMKKTILLSVIFAFVIVNALQAQFQSSFIENELIFGETLKLASYDNLSNDNKSKKITLLLPSIGLNFLSPHLTYGDIYEPDKKLINLVTASRSQKDFDVHANARMSYGGFGVQLGKYKLSLMHEFTLDGTAHLPNHLFVAATKGNTALINSTLEINPSFQMQSVHKWSLGMDYRFKKIMAGIQIHYLQGDAYFDTNASFLNINMEDNFFEIALDKNVDIRSSGTINYHSVDSVEFIIEENAFSPFGKSANKGFGLSTHVKYMPNSSFTLFGRLEDLGYITWNNQTNVLTDQSEYEFKGFDVQQAYSTGASINLRDTINSIIAVEKQSEAFKGTLNYSVMLGTQYQLHKAFSVGVIARSKKYGQRDMLFIETQAIVKPLPYTFLTCSNIYYKTSPLNLKMVLQTEIKGIVGINLSVINPWQFSTYYEANMLQASMGLYVKI